MRALTKKRIKPHSAHKVNYANRAVAACRDGEHPHTHCQFLFYNNGLNLNSNKPATSSVWLMNSGGGWG